MDYELDLEIHEVGLILAFAVFFALNVIDVISTIIGLSHGLIELNWLAVWTMGRIGMLPGLVLLKALFLGIIGVTTYAVLRETPFSFLDDDLLTVGLVLLNILGFFVLSNNLSYLGLWPSHFPVYHFKTFF